MKPGGKNRQTSVFFKIIVVFLAVVFPLYLFILQLNIKGQNDVRKEILDSAKSKTNFYLASLENEFANIMRSQKRLLSDDTLQQASLTPELLDDYEKVKALLSIQKKLLELREISRYIQQAAIFLPRLDKKVTPDIIENLPSDEFLNLRDLLSSGVYPFSGRQGRIFINIAPYYIKIPYGGEMVPPFIISVELSGTELSKVLRQFSGKLQGGAALIGNKNGLRITNGSFPELFRHFENNPAQSVKRGRDSDILEVTVNNRKYIVSFAGSQMLQTTLLVYTPEREFYGTLVRYRRWLMVISAVTALVILFFTLWIKRMIMAPLDNLVEAFRRLESGDLQISMAYGTKDEFGYLYQRFNEMCARLRTLIEQDYEQEIRLRNAELKQLQYQINPHFLYNTIFIIQRMAKMHDEEGILKLAQHLGNYYQYVTRSAAEEVPLEKELKHARDYIEVQTIRFGKRIKVQFDVLLEDYGEINVPRLILQPIIENSYNHGLKDKARGGKLCIAVAEEAAFLKIRVEDNGSGMEEEKLRALTARLDAQDPEIENTGLLNVHRRLRIKYGPEAGIKVFKGTLGGLSVEMSIPLQDRDKSASAG
ncbi:MAG: sensor histidine kinase [Bacillota bacterium]